MKSAAAIDDHIAFHTVPLRFGIYRFIANEFILRPKSVEISTCKFRFKLDLFIIRFVNPASKRFGEVWEILN